MAESAEDPAAEVEDTAKDVSPREPLSRPISPPRNPRAARTIVSFDWEPFDRDLATPEPKAEETVEEDSTELTIVDPVAGSEASHRTTEKLAAMLKKLRLND